MIIFSRFPIPDSRFPTPYSRLPIFPCVKLNRDWVSSIYWLMLYN
ncbi:hypothetical protein BJP36_37785 [Moorena producens JHB]|uniref:Uncharacterized protein n=1 Tax=Moorena producens (strain JHB) TaxID=1454205 RepID=A0A9Q9SUF4_MOOP1|nr:hypothetical protein [Moorena producens]WAN69848.1 hypothetical protein BJP36_37785 [Moorena producens JHB]